MRHEKKENRGRPSEKPVEIVRQFTREFDDSIWYYDLDKTDKGPYLVEMTDAYNLRPEVEAEAEKIYGEKNKQFHVFSRIDAYLMAYQELIE